MAYINIGLLIWAVVGPALSGIVVLSASSVHSRITKAAAIKAERDKQVGICATQLSNQALAMQTAVNEGVGSAGAASDAVTPTPADMAARVALCKADTACRSRGRLP